MPDWSAGCTREEQGEQDLQDQLPALGPLGLQPKHRGDSPREDDSCGGLLFVGTVSESILIAPECEKQAS